MKTADNKSLLSLDEQISLFRKSGMVITDETYATQCLSNVPFNRLRGYWIPNKINASGEASIFSSFNRFEDVFDLYIFDRKLRLIVMDAVEWTEVAIRAKWSGHVGIKYGEFGYIDRQIYRGNKKLAKANNDYDDMKKTLISEFERLHDREAETYRKNNPNRKEPPIWMATEAMSLGLLIKFINGLRYHDRVAIAEKLYLAEDALISMMRNIYDVRNICCHHGRLWSRNLVDQNLKLARHPESLVRAMEMTTDCRRLHNTLVVLDYFLSVTFPEFGKEWRRGLFDHLRSCPLPYPKALGFPAEWEEWAPWHDSQQLPESDISAG